MKAKNPKLRVEMVSVDALRPYCNNAKIHTPEQIEQIKKSILEFGFNDPIAIDEDNMVIEGHGRLLAVKELGWEEVEAIRLHDLSDEQKRAYILVHNQLTLNTGFDLDALQIELANITDLDMGEFGFDLDLSIDTKMDFGEDKESESEPQVFGEPKVKRGQIWKCGNHRLMCGSSTDKKDVKKLFERLILNSSRRGENVIDFFGGSGTTLIACEHTGRNAYVMELDETYCSTALSRWEEETGQKGELVK